MTDMDYEQKYKEALEMAKVAALNGHQNLMEGIFPELKANKDEQNILFEELKAIHLRMEHQTVCNDAGGNKMWRRAWQHVNEAINIIQEDKGTFKW